MNVLFFISSLGSGGAERVVSIIANSLARSNSNVTIVSFDQKKEPFYKIDGTIKIVHLDILGISKSISDKILRNIKSANLIRETIINCNPDVIISFMDKTNIKVIIASIRLNIPIVISERSDPKKRRISMVWKILRRIVYPFADALVVQTNAAYKYFIQYNSKIKTIPNPVLLYNQFEAHPKLMVKNPFIVALGRLSWEKNYEALLESFSYIKDKHSDWSIVIIGAGPLKEGLEKFISNLGLEGRVVFLGEIKNPQSILSCADLFVMSSRLEGFPNALCEAMACGLPVISTDCSNGLREIIRNGIDGILVPLGDNKKLASSMDQLMSDEVARRRLGMRAREITERFSLDNVMDQWQLLLKEVIPKTIKS